MKHLIRSVLLLFGLLSGLVACDENVALSQETPAARITPSPAPSVTPELISTARFERGLCPFVLPEKYVQGQNVECGFLVAPEDRSHLPSRAIRLAVGIFHPEGSASQPDPVIYLSGGPGGSALEQLRYSFDFFQFVLDSGRTLVLFDQRGVGVSRPALDCPNVDKVSKDLMDGEIAGRVVSDEEGVGIVLEALRVCRDRLRQIADLSAYNSAAGAADVRDLRLVLGYAGVNLWGGSYGTRLALEVMRSFPDGIRSVVLDSVYPPDVDLYESSPANAGRAFEVLFSSCAQNQVCNGNYPNLRQVFFDTVERLNAEPVQSTITNTLTGEVYLARLTGDGLIGLVFTALYDSDLHLLLPQIIYDASRDHFDTLNIFRGSLLAQMDAMSRGMTYSVQCNEEASFSSQSALQRELVQYPEFAGLFEHSIQGGQVFQLCEFWGAGKAAGAANQPVTSDIPTLVMTGVFDPITPPAWGRHAAETLENAYFFEYPGVGHGASGVVGCPQEMVLAFLNNPSMSPNADCMADMAGGVP